MEEFLVELWQFRPGKWLYQAVGSEAKKKFRVVFVMMIRSVLVVEAD